ncbi:MAG: recombinase family protein [Clostridia bacterium]|nr:recombinase family protein [Clostridia bacterium]
MAYCIYLRKSRADAEAEMRGEGETLARHEKTLTELANRMKLKISKIYREIVSGETIAARPEMQKLLADVSRKMWDGVLVMDIDRLARGNSIDQGIISQTFRFAGTKIITPLKIYDPNNEFDEEYFEFGLFMSRREYKTINRRLQRGRTASVKEGKYVGNKAPYGYERVKLSNDKGYTLSIVEQQAEVIQNIFEWYTVGKLQTDGTRKHIGTSLIARELNSRNISSYTNGVWTSSTVRDILINPVYIGKIRWNRRPEIKKMINGKVVTQRPRSDDYILCDGLHSPIISEETFELAAEIMNKNAKRPIRNDKTVLNPLASLVICQKCGRKMQRRPLAKNPDMLICPEPTCDNHSAYLHFVEKSVINIMKSWTENYTIEKRKNCNILADNIDSYKKELAAVIKSENTLKNQLDRAYEAFETGIYDSDTFKMRCSSIKERLSNIQSQKDEITKAIEQDKINQNNINNSIPTVKKITDIYYTLKNPQLKNSFLKEIIDHITFRKAVYGHGHEDEFEITVYPKIPGI